MHNFAGSSVGSGRTVAATAAATVQGHAGLGRGTAGGTGADAVPAAPGPAAGVPAGPAGPPGHRVPRRQQAGGYHVRRSAQQSG